MYKRVISFILVSVMAFNFFAADIVMAAEQEIVSEKTNYDFISVSNLKEVEYTYEEDGEIYSVFESTNEELSEVCTKIYKNTKDGRILVQDFVTYIQSNDEGICIKKYSNGILVDENVIRTENSSYNDVVTYAGTTYSGAVYYDGSTRKYYTGWYYDYTNDGSNFVQNLTYSVIVSVLTGVFSKSKPVTSQVLGTIAQKILDENLSTVYWRQQVYHVNQITYPERTLYGSFIGQRIYTTFYSNSARTNVIGSEVGEWHDSTEWPTCVTIGAA